MPVAHQMELALWKNKATVSITKLHYCIASIIFNGLLVVCLMPMHFLTPWKPSG
jgi:hypothetical protein